MTVTLALAGDTMLGRKVAEHVAAHPDELRFADEVVAIAREADLFLLNLECCVSDGGQPWPDPHKPFFFRAPPVAVRQLTALGTDVVTLANNHALDFGAEALIDTVAHLGAAGIACVGAGEDVDAARSPAVFDLDGLRVGVVAATDHPRDFAAGEDRPGTAYVDLRRGDGLDGWLVDRVATLDADLVLATPHWGPNMVADPVPHVRRAATGFLDAGADIVAGHSAHVFHGVEQRGSATVLYDLGDFLDDYAVDDRLRNDLGLLWLLEVDERGPVHLEAVPLALDYCSTRLAKGRDAAWISQRLATACAALGTEMTARGDRLAVALR